MFVNMLTNAILSDVQIYNERNIEQVKRTAYFYEPAVVF
jgi:hypothetical protein